jgi:ribonuclease R
MEKKQLKEKDMTLEANIVLALLRKYGKLSIQELYDEFEKLNNSLLNKDQKAFDFINSLGCDIGENYSINNDNLVIATVNGLISSGIIDSNSKELQSSSEIDMSAELSINTRYEVLRILEDKYDAMSFESIMHELKIESPVMISELKDTLDRMVNDLEIYVTNKNKYILLEHMPNFKVGEIDVKPQGFGFLLIPDGPDVHIDRSAMNGALDGDKVLVEVLGNNPANPEGKVLKVIERNKKNVVGEIKIIKSKKVFVPKDKKYENATITLDPRDLNKCVDGEIVAVTIDNDMSTINNYKATFKKSIGHKNDPDMDILTLAAQYDVFQEFPEDAMEQANAIPQQISPEDIEGRTDYRDKMIFTIDGKDTKDIDDAISLDINEEGKYVLGVHIADVSHYIPENSPLDREALRRATSNYPADKVIPQLPHKLSDGICSLNEGEDRLTISCEMVINWNGSVDRNSVRVFPSVIKSKKKMNYTDCNAILEGVVDPKYEPFKDKLLEMVEVHKMIRKERQRRGATDFDAPEIKFVFDENHHAIDVVARERGEFEKVIEDFMICANEAVAREFQNYNEWGLPAIYRVHDLPSPERIQKFIAYCNTSGQHIVGKFAEVDNAKMFQKILSQIDAEGEEREIIMKMAIRTMAKACYQKENIGHFGLASDCYTHFTSPIRRYPDLLVHRLLWTYFFKGLANDDRTVRYWDAHIDAIAKQSSDRERNADDLERAVNDMYSADYMTDHIGEEYDAIVSGVTSKALYVQLPNKVEGKLDFNDMLNDNYVFNKDNDSVTASHSNKTYRMGTRLRVKCIDACKEESRITFKQLSDTRENEGKKKVKC